MASIKVGDSFPEGTKFTYIPYTPEKSDITACGIPITYNASKGWCIPSFLSPIPFTCLIRPFPSSPYSLTYPAVASRHYSMINS